MDEVDYYFIADTDYDGAEIVAKWADAYSVTIDMLGWEGLTSLYGDGPFSVLEDARVKCGDDFSPSFYVDGYYQDENFIPEYEGHTLAGWSHTKYGEKELEPKESETVSGDTTYYAVWTTETNHQYGDWTVTKQPTVAEEGSKSRTCSICGHTETQTIEKLTDPAASQSQQPQTEAQQPQAPVEQISVAKTPSKVKARARKNKVTVSWKKIKRNKKGKAFLKQISGIQVQYSTDPNFPAGNTVTRSLGKKRTRVKLKLLRKTTYYVRVRYVGSGGYSNWSKVKRVKTK